jgi:hypothetical protein
MAQVEDLELEVEAAPDPRPPIVSCGSRCSAHPCLKRVDNPITNNNLHVQLTPYAT